MYIYTYIYIQYDTTMPLDQRIEAHDIILTVDGESATDANILGLLRGGGKVYAHVERVRVSG